MKKMFDGLEPLLNFIEKSNIKRRKESVTIYSDSARSYCDNNISACLFCNLLRSSIICNFKGDQCIKDSTHKLINLLLLFLTVLLLINSSFISFSICCILIIVCILKYLLS